MLMPASSEIGALFEAEGRREVVGGNTPFLLNDRRSVWWVMSGHVEIFSVAVENGQPQGARFHFCSAHEGQAFFGLRAAADGVEHGLLAVGRVGTELIRLDLERLQTATRNAGVSPALVELIDSWIERLSAGVSAQIVPQPRADLLVAPGDEQPLATGKRARSRKGVTWIRHTEGHSLFLGMEEIAAGDHVRVPLTADSFVQALGDAWLASCDTATALADGSAWSGLDALHDAMLRCEFFNVRLAAADELNRLRGKAERDRRVRSASLGDLAAVLEERPPELHALDSDNPLVDAATIIGRHAGFTIRQPPKPKEGEEVLDPLGELVHASRVRIRRVTLAKNWWALDGAAMLGTLANNKRPVALLPAGGGKWDLHDPVDRSHRRVTADVAATLAPEAHTFYRPFPAEPVTPYGLLRFAFFNGTADVLRPLILGMAAGALGILSPYFLGRLVDTVIPEAARNQLLELAIILAIIGVTTTAFNLVRDISVVRLQVRTSSAVQPAMWDRVLALPIAFFRGYSAGDLTQRVNAVDEIRQTLSTATMSSLMTSVFSLFLFAQLFYYSANLAFVATALVASMVFITTAVAWRKLRMQRVLSEEQGRLSGLVLQLLTGIAKIRVAGAEDRAFAEWARRFAGQKRAALAIGRLDAGLATFNSGFSQVATMALFATVMTLTRSAMTSGALPMSVGDFIAFSSAFGIFLNQMLALGASLVSALVVLPMFERARPVLEAAPEVSDAKADPGELAGRISVDRVSFRYHQDGPLILNDVSMQIAPGEFVAFVGASGSGKSTLLRLLLGLEIPEHGSISYDGRDLAQLDVQRLRRRIGVVTQNGKIRSGSIYWNIVGESGRTLDEAWVAARMAGLDEDLQQMPMGMHTILQAGGGTLSGGQRQRLMIARAIVNRPRILFFDEATSALDNRTQAIVTASLQELQATRIVVAHRLSTIESADMIHVMAGGRVVQTGTYQELASREGLFASLIHRQLA